MQKLNEKKKRDYVRPKMKEHIVLEARSGPPSPVTKRYRSLTQKRSRKH